MDSNGSMSYTPASSDLSYSPYPDDHTPPAATDYIDFRSPQKAHNRQMKQKQKYYGYRGVHPSWVGQQYYTITVVREQQMTVSAAGGRQGLKQRVPGTGTSTSAAPEAQHDEELLEELLSKDIFWMFTLPATIEMAVSEAHERSTRLGPSDTLNAPRTLASLSSSTYCDALHTIDPQHTTFSTSSLDPSTPSLPVTLTLTHRTWTRTDNYTQKSYYSAGPDRRHSRSRRIRERRCAGYNAVLRRRGRGDRDAARYDLGDHVAEELGDVVCLDSVTLGSTALQVDYKGARGSGAYTANPEVSSDVDGFLGDLDTVLVSGPGSCVSWDGDEDERDQSEDFDTPSARSRSECDRRLSVNSDSSAWSLVTGDHAIP